jgi:hypothetical protein
MSAPRYRITKSSGRRADDPAQRAQYAQPLNAGKGAGHTAAQARLGGGTRGPAGACGTLGSHASRKIPHQNAVPAHGQQATTGVTQIQQGPSFPPLPQMRGAAAKLASRNRTRAPIAPKSCLSTRSTRAPTLLVQSRAAIKTNAWAFACLAARAPHVRRRERESTSGNASNPKGAEPFIFTISPARCTGD